MKIELYVRMDDDECDFRARLDAGYLLFYYYPIKNIFLKGIPSKSNKKRLSKC